MSNSEPRDPPSAPSIIAPGTMHAHSFRADWLEEFANRMSALELPDAPVIDPDACCDLENPEACDSCQ